MAPFIQPTAEQLRVFSDSPSDGPVVMLNLLRYKADGGRDSYDRYGAEVQPLLQKVGAEIVWYGQGDSVVIGDDSVDAWDAVILVRYPSRRAFLDMVLSPEYQAIGELRTAGLDDSRLIACTELFGSAART